MKNLVVAKYLDGRLIKGKIRDFRPNQDIFHVIDEADKTNITPIFRNELKALFFVKSTSGDRDYVESNDPTKRKMYGRLLEVEFTDGEVIRGFSQIYRPRDPGFFLFPVDENSNNERIYVNRMATRSIRIIEMPG